MASELRVDKIIPTGGVPSDSVSGNTTFFGAGGVIQVVSSIETGAVSTTSTSFINSGQNCVITPKFSTSKILVLFNCANYNNGDDGHTYWTIYRDSTNLGHSTEGFTLASCGDNGRGRWNHCSMHILDNPATTSAVTYKIYFRKGTAGTSYMRLNDSHRSFMTVMEVS